MRYRYGYFNEDGTEFIITNPKTPRAFDNFLWNDAVFSNVSQTGVGYFDYQYDDKEAVQLLTGVGRICDFDIFGRDHLMNRLIYVRDNETGEYWNVNWEPVKKEYENFECRQGMGYMLINSKTSGISSELRIFVPKGKDPVELWTLNTKNESDKTRNLSIGVNVLFDIEKDPTEQVNLIDDPLYKDVVKELNQIMIKEIFSSILAANDDKVVNRGGIVGEGPFGERGWKRTYP